MTTQHLKMVLGLLYALLCFAVLVVFVRTGHPVWAIVPVVGLLLEISNR